MTCACGQPLWAAPSIASGICRHCTLYGPAAPGSRMPEPPEPAEDAPVAVEPSEDDDGIGSGAQFKKRRSAAAPLPPGPPCIHCSQATHARTQRDDGQPAHLDCTGLHAPSVTDEPVVDVDGAALAAAVRAIEPCEHGRVRLPVWTTDDSTALSAGRLWDQITKEAKE